MACTHLLKHAAHANHTREDAPLKSQKEGCRRIKNANTVLRRGESALANLHSRISVLVVRTGTTHVLYKV